MVRSMALAKLWQHHYGQLLDKPLNVIGHVVRFAREQGAYAPMIQEEFARTEGPTIDECIAKTVAGVPGFAADLVNVHFPRSKILCLSEVPTSILMWSHYAQNHSGIVLRFTDATFNNPLKRAKPMQYVKHMPSLFDDDSFSDFLAGYGSMEPRRIMDDLIWSKSNQWAYEREWRVYAGDGRISDAPHEDIPFGANELDGVIFGMRTAQRDRTAVLRMLKEKYPHVELLQATANPTAYEMTLFSV